MWADIGAIRRGQISESGVAARELEVGNPNFCLRVNQKSISPSSWPLALASAGEDFTIHWFPHSFRLRGGNDCDFLRRILIRCSGGESVRMILACLERENWVLRTSGRIATNGRAIAALVMALWLGLLIP